MIAVDNVLFSDEIADEHFVCDLTRCKGACCVEGDAGAPLAEDELLILEKKYTSIRPYLSEEGIKSLEAKGLYVRDEEGDWGTTLLVDGTCAYATKDANGALHCGIEKAYLEGAIDWKKPISCHLYPARINTLTNYVAVNYDRWEICSPACDLGNNLQVKVYQFLKEPLIRRFGAAFYSKLVDVIEHPDRPSSVSE